MGIEYVPADELIDLPLEQIVKRLQALAIETNAEDRSVRSALLGLAPAVTDGFAAAAGILSIRQNSRRKTARNGDGL